MSVTRGNAITQADMDALATLANTKMGADLAADPAPPDFIFHPFEFSFMDEDVLPPTDVVGSVTYSVPPSTDRRAVCIRVYSYKVVGGRRHYSKKFASGHVMVDGGVYPLNPTFWYFEVLIDWSWTAPGTGADGYIAIHSGGGDLFQEPINGDPRFDHYWRDVIGTSIIGDDTSTGWNNSNIIDSFDYNYCPTESGQWRREMGRIKRAAYTYGTLDQSWLVSGPWCVAVGSRLNQGTSAGNDSHKEIEFWYPADNHLGDVVVNMEHVIATKYLPQSIYGSIIAGNHFNQTLNYFYQVAGGLVTCEITWTQSGTGTGWTHSLVVETGSISILSQSWSETTTTLTLVFSALLPSGSSALRVQATCPSGNITSTPGLPNARGLLFGQTVLTSLPITPTIVQGIHPSSAIKKITVGNFNVSLGLSVYNAMRDVLSLNTGIDGVWVAKTLPVFCVNTYLEAKIPTGGAYSGDGTVPNTTSQRGRAYKYNEELNEFEFEVIPSVNARPSMWPVFRDTDILTWKTYPGGTQDYLVPFFANGYFITFRSQTILPGEHRSYLYFPADNFEAGKIEAEGTTLPIYFSQVDYPDPDNPATYDGVVPSPMRMPSDYNPTPGVGVLYTIKNNTADAVTFNLRMTFFHTLDGTIGGWWPGPVPVFFFRTDETRGAFERYSYNFTGPKTSGGLGIQSETPLSGYCITELKVQRAAIGTPAVIPASGTSALVVKIGLMRGTTNDTLGTFEELLSVTIPSGDSSVTQSVFWPVLEGAALIYQASELVEVFASANFQPEFVTRYVVDAAAPTSGNSKLGKYAGTPIEFSFRLLYFINSSFRAGSGWTESPVTFPACATVYNDLEALLNEL